MKNRTKWLMAALAMTGVAGAVMGQTASSSSGGAEPGTPGAHHWHRGHGMMLGGGLMHAFHQLNLTPAQQQSVHTILTAAHAQFAAERKAGGRPDFAVLSNPGDPNYATALQDLQTRMANHIQEQSATELALYKVLTTQQQQQLPQILASMKGRMGQHSAT
ncbi:MAG TPA: Spy/CpxP family protein refolding chaperone [Steroidobacteraceae bacterium]